MTFNDVIDTAWNRFALHGLAHRGDTFDFVWNWPAGARVINLAVVLQASSLSDEALIAVLQSCNLHQMGDDKQPIWVLGNSSREVLCSVNLRTLSAGQQVRLAHGDHIEVGLTRLQVCIPAGLLGDGRDEGQDLLQMQKLLEGIAGFNTSAAMNRNQPTHEMDPTILAPLATRLAPFSVAGAMKPSLGADWSDQGEQIRQMFKQVRQWIDQNEPSSPVSVMLKQADRMWGKRFSEVATMIPPDLLQAWDRED